MIKFLIATFFIFSTFCSYAEDINNDNHNQIALNLLAEKKPLAENKAMFVLMPYANKGDAVSQYYLGLIYLSSTNKDIHNQKLAQYWLGESAKLKYKNSIDVIHMLKTSKIWIVDK